jgi:glutathione S-transferase
MCANLEVPACHTLSTARPSMKLYVTYTSPYARLARIVVVEKKLEGRVEILQAKTRTAGSPYYQINPSGRVPYLMCLSRQPR